MRISVLDNHSNFTIKFTATYCNSAKHISYFLIRPSGMCTFCSLSGIFRANQIYNLPFNGYRICDVFGDRFSSQGWQNHVGDIFNIRNRSPTETLANISYQHRWSASIEKGLKTHYFFCLFLLILTKTSIFWIESIWRNCLKSDCGFIFGFLVDFGKIIHFCWIKLFD